VPIRPLTLRLQIRVGDVTSLRCESCKVDQLLVNKKSPQFFLSATQEQPSRTRQSLISSHAYNETCCCSSCTFDNLHLCFSLLATCIFHFELRQRNRIVFLNFAAIHSNLYQIRLESTDDQTGDSAAGPGEFQNQDEMDLSPDAPHEIVKTLISFTFVT